MSTIIFITGLILGAVLGVVADRLWSWFERIPRLDIFGGARITPDDVTYKFEITNRGTFEIPPYRVRIIASYACRHSTIFFTRNKEGGQLPNQIVTHEYVVFEDGKLTGNLINFGRDMNNNPMNEVQKGEFTFQLVLDYGRKVIYENRKIGIAFVKMLQKVSESGSVRETHYYDWDTLQAQYEPLYRKLPRIFRAKFIRK